MWAKRSHVIALSNAGIDHTYSISEEDSGENRMFPPDMWIFFCPRIPWRWHHFRLGPCMVDGDSSNIIFIDRSAVLEAGQEVCLDWWIVRNGSKVLWWCDRWIGTNCFLRCSVRSPVWKSWSGSIASIHTTALWPRNESPLGMKTQMRFINVNGTTAYVLEESGLK